MTTSIMHIDLETENHEYYGSKASPYCPDNYVVEMYKKSSEEELRSTFFVNSR